MMSVEPSQKKVATIASPVFGLWGSNPFAILLPPAKPAVPFHTSSAMGPAASGEGGGDIVNDALVALVRPDAFALSASTVASHVQGDVDVQCASPSKNHVQCGSIESALTWGA